MKPTKTLEETVELMLSTDPNDQLKAEYYQAENRFITLSEMLTKWDIGKLDFNPEPPNRYTYGNLLGNLRNYLLTLKDVLKAKGIDTEGSVNDNTASIS